MLDARLPDPARWPQCPAYVHGCALYDHGYWWEAHEHWEDVWRDLDREAAAALLLKGLIQAAACALQLEAGRERGVRRLRDRTARLLRRSLELAPAARGDRFMGLDVPAWLAGFEAYYDDDRRVHDLTRFPTLAPA
ncbi:MAG: DUF309 domain-containing protein [Planctomycetota bacterium]